MKSQPGNPTVPVLPVRFARNRQRKLPLQTNTSGLERTPGNAWIYSPAFSSARSRANQPFLFSVPVFSLSRVWSISDCGVPPLTVDAAKATAKQCSGYSDCAHIELAL